MLPLTATYYRMIINFVEIRVEIIIQMNDAKKGERDKKDCVSFTKEFLFMAICVPLLGRGLPLFLPNLPPHREQSWIMLALQMLAHLFSKFDCVLVNRISQYPVYKNTSRTNKVCLWEKVCKHSVFIVFAGFWKKLSKPVVSQWVWRQTDQLLRGCTATIFNDLHFVYFLCT